MDRIYREADHVISWVGDVAEGSLEILIISSPLLFNKESDELRSRWLHHHRHLVPLPRKDTLTRRDFGLISSALEQLSKSRYWTRMWVVEEFVLPRKVTL
jgi:hypothetical protein